MSFPLIRILLIGTAVVFFAVAIFLFIRGTREGKNASRESFERVSKPVPEAASAKRAASAEPPQTAQPPVQSTAQPAVAASVAAPATATESKPDKIDDTETDFPLNRRGEPPAAPKRAEVPTLDEVLAAEKAGEYAKAAELWRRRADFQNELRLLPKTTYHAREAELHRALGQTKRAIGVMRGMLSEAPTDELLRQRLIEALLDTGNLEEANWLANVLLEADAPFKPRGEFFAHVGRAFEASRDLNHALDYYKAAIRFGYDHSLVPNRILYLEHLLRLRRPTETGEGEDQDEAVKFLERAFDDTHFSNLGPQETPSDRRNPRHHEVVLGHHAFGRVVREPRISVSSRTSTAGRFEVLRLVKAGPKSATFEGADRFLDYPVIIKLVRLPLPPREMDLISARFWALSHIGHPNISRPAYIDRFGDVVRVVTDYHANGTMRSMIESLDRVGMPLLLRLLLQITAGVCAAHRHGIVHGDLRVENVLIGHDNLVKIVDFALEPWPVRKMAPDETPRVGSPGGLISSEIQTDIGMFADIIDFLADNVRLAPISGTFGDGVENVDPLDLMRQVATRCRSGEFDSILHVHRELTRLFERSLPGQRDPMQTA